MDEQKARQLTLRYLAGVITRDEERQLFAFIEEDESHKALFRNWEKQWMQSSRLVPSANSAWETLEPMLQDEAESRPNLHIWRKVAAAAAVVLLLFGTSLATWHVVTQRPEQFYALTAPMGSTSRLTLPDGSVVWLNAGSTLRYSTNFSVDNRNVELRGEGYFEVAKHDGNDFTVKTTGYDVTVKGTKFDVSAYDDDPVVSTSLMQGKVMISQGETVMEMKPGETVTLDKATGCLTKTVTSATPNAWTMNSTDFNEIRLGDFAKILSRKYGVEIHITSQKVRDIRLAMTLQNRETIEDVLQSLKIVTGTRIVRDGKQIYIKEK